MSDGIYDSLNCGLGTTDERDRVFENRARAVKAAAKAAHAAADNLEESYRQQSDASRAAAQKIVAEAKADAEKVDA